MRIVFGFKKCVCSVVTTVFTTVQVLMYAPVASADAIDDYASQGTQFGKETRNWTLNNLPTLDGKKIKIKKQNGEEIEIENTDSMTGSTSKSSRYSIETTSEAMDELKEIAGDLEKRSDAATSRKDALMGAIQKIVQGDSDAQVTIENTVYSLIDDLASTKLPDYSEDAMWEMTRSILENLAEHAEDLASCDSSTSTVTRDEVVHIPNEVQCQQVLDRTGECELTHEYGIQSIVTHVSGPMNVGRCKNENTGAITPYCVRIWAGTLGFHTQGSGTVRSSVKFAVKNVSAITSARLVYMSTEDEGQAFFGPVGDLKQYYYRYSYRDCSQWDPWGYFKPIDCGHEASFSRDQEAGSYFKNETGTLDFLWDIKNRPDGTVFDFTVNNYVPSGSGGGYGAMEITFNPSLIHADFDSWGPTSCMDVVTGISDGVADGTFTCTDMPSLDSSGCYVEGMMSICESMVDPSPFEDISPLCRKVKVSGNFNFYKGDTGCWQGYMGSDAEGNPIYEEVCGGENVGGNLDTCEEYEKAGCTFLGSKCTEGMTGASGNCYVADITYDCGTDEIVSKTTTETDYTCTGIRCLGTECAEVNETKSTDFAKVNALMNMIDQAGQDMTCTGTDENRNITGTANVTCQVFKGEKGQCKIAVGGWQNCCKENSTSPSIHTYIKTMRSVSAVEASTEGISKMLKSANTISAEGLATDIVDGAWGIGSGVMWQLAGQYVSFINKDTGNIIQAVAATPKFMYRGAGWLMDKAFTGATENITKLFNKATSWTKDLFKPISDFMSEIKQKIAKEIENLLTKCLNKLGINLQKEASQQMVENTTKTITKDQTTGTLSSAIGTAVAVVGYIYMAYMVAKMVVSMVYACEEEEMETVSKVAIKGCHYVGTYCEDKVLGVCIMKKRTYCCYQSPLGRILNEQIRLQTEDVTQEDGTIVKVSKIQDWGSAESPNCQGLSVEDLNKVDWDAIDLTEWTHILETNNLSMEQEKALTEENMTGKAQAYR